MAVSHPMAILMPAKMFLQRYSMIIRSIPSTIFPSTVRLMLAIKSSWPSEIPKRTHMAIFPSLGHSRPAWLLRMKTVAVSLLSSLVQETLNLPVISMLRQISPQALQDQGASKSVMVMLIPMKETSMHRLSVTGISILQMMCQLVKMSLHGLMAKAISLLMMMSLLKPATSRCLLKKETSQSVTM